jgi:hypothetical protein
MIWRAETQALGACCDLRSLACGLSVGEVNAVVGWMVGGVCKYEFLASPVARGGVSAFGMVSGIHGDTGNKRCHWLG